MLGIPHHHVNASLFEGEPRPPVLALQPRATSRCEEMRGWGGASAGVSHGPGDLPLDYAFSCWSERQEARRGRGQPPSLLRVLYDCPGAVTHRILGLLGVSWVTGTVVHASECHPLLGHDITHPGTCSWWIQRMVEVHAESPLALRPCRTSS